MVSSFIEHQIENAVQDVAGDKAVRVMKGVKKVASKQGGENALENYKLLGKRALITLGVVVVTVQVATSVVSLVVARRNEEQRIERIVRRVIAEDRHNQR